VQRHGFSEPSVHSLRSSNFRGTKSVTDFVALPFMETEHSSPT
jgi:hypothetical protein